MAKRAAACYGIRKGRGAPVVVHSWAEVVAKTHGFSGAEFKKFKSEKDAAAYVKDQHTRAREEPGPPPPGSTTLWFDGGSRGNPGMSGAGAVIFDDSEKELFSGYKYVGDRNTNNEAEYEGLLLGLRAAVRLGTKRLVVKGDSMLVIQQMMGRWRVSAPKLVGLHREASKLVNVEKLECNWQHVRRHLNARADLLANIAIDSRGTGEVFDPTVPAALECASAPTTTPASAKPNSGLMESFGTSGPTENASQHRPCPIRSSAPLSLHGASTAFVGDEREAVAIAAARAAYEAVAANARAEIAGCREVPEGDSSKDGSDTQDSIPGRGADVSRAKRILGGEASSDGAEGQDARRFVIHVASWREAEDAGGGVPVAEASPAAAATTGAAAILYEKGERGKLKNLMRVARCCKESQDFSLNRLGSDSGGSWERVDAARPLLPADETLRVLEESLRKAERLGGGDVAVVTNDLALHRVLSAPDPESERGLGGAAESPPASQLPTLKRVLKLWANLGGVTLEWSGGSKLAAAMTLARCCANPTRKPSAPSSAPSISTGLVPPGVSSGSKRSAPTLPEGVEEERASQIRRTGARFGEDFASGSGL